MLRIWFIFCLGSFAVSVLTLTYVQICVWKKHGWSALRKRPLAATYWANLSPVERVLLWLGFVALYITLVSATGWKVVNLFGQRVGEAMAQTSNPPLEPISGYGTLPHFINVGSAASRYFHALLVNELSPQYLSLSQCLDPFRRKSQ